MGIFAGSGVGKSTLMGMIARKVKADLNVIALVGERGREVREFIENDLGEEGMARSVVVVATSTQTETVIETSDDGNGNSRVLLRTGQGCTADDG